MKATMFSRLCINNFFSCCFFTFNVRFQFILSPKIIFPYEILYPAFERRSTTPILNIYSIGSDQLAPYALARWHGDVNQVIAAFISAQGISIVATDSQMRLLATYCHEHWRGHLDISSASPFGYTSLYQATCLRRGV